MDAASDDDGLPVVPAGAARVFELSAGRLLGPFVLRQGSARRGASARVSLPDGESEHVEVDCRRCSYPRTKGIKVDKEAVEIRTQ